MQQRVGKSAIWRVSDVAFVIAPGVFVSAASAQKFPWQDTPEAGGKTPQTVRFAGPDQTNVAAHKPQVVELHFQIQDGFHINSHEPHEKTLIPTQLKRLARKASLGLGRNGSYSGDGSGDIFVAFSTANPGAASPKGVRELKMLPNDRIDPLFLATVQATEEAIVNAMVAAETMAGIDGHTAIALPHDRLREVLKKYNRLEK